MSKTVGSPLVSTSFSFAIKVAGFPLLLRCSFRIAPEKPRRYAPDEPNGNDTNADNCIAHTIRQVRFSSLSACAVLLVFLQISHDATTPTIAMTPMIIGPLILRDKVGFL